MRQSRFCLSLAFLFALVALPAQAQPTSPQIGWQAEFSTDFHQVAGTVTVIDEDTLQFDDFVYDGQGISVFFYLGAENTQSAFSSGIGIGDQLLGEIFDGSQDSFLVDLPAEVTLEGFHAISVWCVAADLSFGSGTFTAVDKPSADFDLDGDVDGSDFLHWQRGESTTPPSAADLDLWQTNYGVTEQLSATFTSAPEPSSMLLLLLGILFSKHRR